MHSPLYPLVKKVKVGAKDKPELIYFHEMLSLLSLQLKAATATVASMKVWLLDLSLKRECIIYRLLSR